MQRALKVWVLPNADGSYRAKFHAHDAFDCPGRRMQEERPDGDAYVLVDIRELKPSHPACQFATCFDCQPDAEAVARARIGRPEQLVSAAASAEATPAADEIMPGDLVGVRLGNGSTLQFVLGGPQVSLRSPMARAVVGHRIGEIVSYTVNGLKLNIEILNRTAP